MRRPSSKKEPTPAAAPVDIERPEDPPSFDEQRRPSRRLSAPMEPIPESASPRPSVDLRRPSGSPPAGGHRLSAHPNAPIIVEEPTPISPRNLDSQAGWHRSQRCLLPHGSPAQPPQNQHPQHQNQNPCHPFSAQPPSHRKTSHLKTKPLHAPLHAQIQWLPSLLPAASRRFCSACAPAGDIVSATVKPRRASSMS
ncbi:hypothetical protein BU26DRAFT_107150 [Trematosphaeria pertusa]|uniref:Uncharacterized protein n=1 Tax=Trematosphaeria pertusa TaxID=390896 RepID=A0A6A6I1E1_9PLEO|nr:uncharacterized protein BU26DRAFT_107150 [Trematosphaeria pertusa]KAF2243693.1 hypothetical protein BU26DRAFT_107150 [Trematosphaeria pertusa]